MHRRSWWKHEQALITSGTINILALFYMLVAAFVLATDKIGIPESSFAGKKAVWLWDDNIFIASGDLSSMMAYGHVRPHDDRSRKIRDALLVFGACGALGVLVDVDHAYVLVQKDLPITAGNLIYAAGRPWHLPLLVLLGALCCVAGAYAYRLHKAL